MVMNTMSTFLSLTVHCARCHNHKFDPISQKDYYSLQAVFAGVDRADRDYDTDPATRARRRELRAARKPVLERLTDLTNKVVKISTPDIQALDRRLADIKS